MTSDLSKYVNYFLKSNDSEIFRRDSPLVIKNQ